MRGLVPPDWEARLYGRQDARRYAAEIPLLFRLLGLRTPRAALNLEMHLPRRLNWNSVCRKRFVARRVNRIARRINEGRGNENEQAFPGIFRIGHGVTGGPM